jgi:hypothetical protein
MGSNLIAGISHARDLHYTSLLFKAYNTEKKVFESIMLAEEVGINTMNITNEQLSLLNRYKKMTGSDIQLMVQVHVGSSGYDEINKSMEEGADFIQIWGVSCDAIARTGKVEILQDCVEYIKNKGFKIKIRSD